MSLVLTIQRSNLPYSSPMRHHKRTHSSRAQVKVCPSSPYSNTGRMLIRPAGVVECPFRVHDKRRRWLGTASPQSVHHQAGDWQRFLRRGAPRCRPVWPGICKNACNKTRLVLNTQVTGCQRILQVSATETRTIQPPSQAIESKTACSAFRQGRLQLTASQGRDRWQP
jgi:hypothetical protein